MMRRALSAILTLERSARVLSAIKLANVGLILLWGFAVTYVFVRVLPIDEFQAFLLLVAFSNFTISAEFGVTSILYNRMRRFWLDSGGRGDTFQREEIAAIFLLLIALIGLSALLLAIAMAAGWIATAMPALFLLFFVNACFNVVGLLAKRALAAIDHNLAWEMLEMARRIVSLALLLAVLGGLDVHLSVLLQLTASIIMIAFCARIIHTALSLSVRNWMSPGFGMAHVKRHYLRDLGTSALLTLSEIAAYNAPYFTIALATREARPMLLFDFVFKMARALSATVRAVIEAVLPRLTAAYHQGRRARFVQLLWRSVAAAGVAALLAGTGLALVGQWIVAELFDGHVAIGTAELTLLAVLLLALAVICVSVYLQGALGRFGVLLRQSLPFLMGSLASVPVAAWLAPRLDMPFFPLFLTLYCLTFIGVAMLHGLSLKALASGVEARG